MDRTEEDMKHVGFFGIFKQSFNSIFSWKKLFALITLAFILPLATTFLIQMAIAHHFFWKIDNSTTPFQAADSRETTPMDWLYYALFQIAYPFLLIAFSLLATAVVVFTIASIYTNREVVFRNVTIVIPKVWKRLCVTFIFIYLAQFIYDVIFSIAMAIPRIMFGYNSLYGIVIRLIKLSVYIYGFLYLTVVFQLASVVTVLENIYGISALRKGKNLAKGKKHVGMRIAFVLYGLLLGLNVVYILFVEYGHEVYKLALIWRVLIGILCGTLSLVLFLLFIVTQTVLYLVCKSYHGETIDRFSLSTLLGVYMGETVVYPGSGEEIQLGRPQTPAEQV